jgi:hypothetical protein
VKLIGLFGSESIGKTSTGYMLTGRLRTHDVLAEFVTDSSAAMPFPPERFDTHVAAWMYVLTKKIERECEVALRSNVGVIVSDRTPLDLFAYFKMKHPESPALEAVAPLVNYWLGLYDHLYFFPAAGTTFRYDEFREPTDQSRNTIDQFFLGEMPALRSRLGSRLEVASGSFRERAEFVYHDLLHKLLGISKPKRVMEQVKRYLSERVTTPISEVRLLGSRSVTRAHVASDTDDFDLLITVKADVATALAVDAELTAGKEYLERACEASLDFKVVAESMVPHEV